MAQLHAGKPSNITSYSIVILRNVSRQAVWKRLKGSLRHPWLLLKNLRFHINPSVSHATHVFVLGPPRSGTTLLKSVLVSHPQLVGLNDETFFFCRRNYTDLRIPDIPEKEMQAMIGRAGDFVDLFDRIASYVTGGRAALRFVEKTPQHALHLGALFKYFPRSRVLFIVRDGRDSLVSFRRHFPDGEIMNSEGGYVSVWKKYVEQWRAHREADNVLLVRYEELCRSPDRVMREVMKFVGAPFEPAQLQPGRIADTTSLSDKKAFQRLSKPITTKAVGRWKEELTEQEVEDFQETAGEQLSLLGYSLA